MAVPKYQSPDFCNWVQTAICLYDLRTFLTQNISPKIEESHQKLIRDHGTNWCKKGCFTEKSKSFQPQNGCKPCSDIKIDIEGSHINPNLMRNSWANSDWTNLQICGEYWELAKLFMAKGVDRTNKTPETADISGIYNLCYNFKELHNHWPKLKRINDITEIRNKVMHHKSMELKQKNKSNFLDTMITFLNGLDMDPGGCKELIADFKKTKRQPLKIDTLDEWNKTEKYRNIMTEKLQNLEEKLGNVEEKNQKQVQELNEEVATVKDIVKDIPKLQERLSKTEEDLAELKKDLAEVKEKQQKDRLPSSTKADDELLRDMDGKSKIDFEKRNGRILRKAYQNENIKKVQTITQDDAHYNFDVTSEQYFPVKYKKSEIRNGAGQSKDVQTTHLSHDTEMDQGLAKQKRKRGKSGGGNNGAKKAKRGNDFEEESSEDINEFLATKRNLPVFIEAEAGMGKTVLLRRLALDWANNRQYMSKWKFVFLVSLRQVKNPNESKLEDIICKDLQLLPEDQIHDFKNYMQRSTGEILFLFDGLDEVDLDPDSSILSLHNDTSHSVVYTSRPSSSYEAETNYPTDHPKLHLKLQGFSQKNKKKFVFKRLKNEKAVAQLFTECEKHLFCNTILKVPLYTRLICLLWENNHHKLADTATLLFNKFLKMILQLYLKREKDIVTEVHFERSPLEPTVSLDLRAILTAIARLAYKTLLCGKVLFTEKEVDQNSLSMEVIEKIGLFCIETAEPRVVYFRHKLLHEYFAGLFLSDLEPVRYHLVNKRIDALLSNKDKFQHALYFAAGFSSDAFDDIVKLIEEAKVPGNGGDSNSDITFYEFPLSSDEILPQKVTEFPLQLKDTGKQDSTQPNKKLLQNAFVMQLIFEAQSFPKNFTPLPVWAQSSHSLAAANYISETTNLSKKDDGQGVTSLAIIDSVDSETNELQWVWDDCRKNQSFTTLSLVHPGPILFKNIFQQQWEYITKLELDATCKNVHGPNLNSLTDAIPNLQIIRLAFIPLLLENTLGTEIPVSAKDINVLFGKGDGTVCGRMQREQNSLNVFVNFEIQVPDTISRYYGRPTPVWYHIFPNCVPFFKCLLQNIKHVCLHEEQLSIDNCLDKCKGVVSLCMQAAYISSDNTGKLPERLEKLSICTFQRYIDYYRDNMQSRINLGRILPLPNIKDISVALCDKCLKQNGSHVCNCSDVNSTVSKVLKLLVDIKDLQNQLSSVTFYGIGHLQQEMVFQLMRFCKLVQGWDVTAYHELPSMDNKLMTQNQERVHPMHLFDDCCEKIHWSSEKNECINQCASLNIMLRKK